MMDDGTADRLFEEAAALVEQYEYEEAVDRFQQAHNLAPQNTIIMDYFADALLEIGQVDEAQQISLEIANAV